MKNIFKIKKIKLLPVLFSLLLISLSSCDFSYDIAEANTKADLTPPTADFNFTQGQVTAQAPDGWKTYSFGNASTSSTDYMWDFENGNTATTVDASFTFPGEGTFTVSLTAREKLGKTNKISKTITVVKPIVPVGLVPVILAPGFDFGNVPASKDPWTNSAIGGVLQISASSSFDGGFASKFPLAPDLRIVYQELTVSPNTNYVVTCKYSQEIGTGTVRMAVLKAPVANAAGVNAAILKSVTGSNATGKGNFTPVTLLFKSGANTKIALYVDNSGGTISYVDNFTIALQ
jgi:hypothetical protein